MLVERGASDAGGLRVALDAALERVVSKLQGDVNRVVTSVSSADELLQDRLRRVGAEIGEVRNAVEGIARGGTLPVLASATEAAPTGQPQIGGFEAGAVLGASQAAWNRLEQRLDHDFDDLTTEVQQLRNSLEVAVRALESLAERPASAEQVQGAAAAVRDSITTGRRRRRN
jgi:hypothetical protein